MTQICLWYDVLSHTWPLTKTADCYSPQAEGEELYLGFHLLQLLHDCPALLAYVHVVHVVLALYKYLKTA